MGCLILCFNRLFRSIDFLKDDKLWSGLDWVWSKVGKGREQIIITILNSLQFLNHNYGIYRKSMSDLDHSAVVFVEGTESVWARLAKGGQGDISTLKVQSFKLTTGDFIS